MLQSEALSILKTGASVFLTGEPGAGKTHVTNEYIAWLRAHGIAPAITASTGIAATHIGGMTIHSWSGIGVAQTLSAYDLDRIAQDKRVVSRILNTSTLIIDEVSMLSEGVLTMVDMVCKEVRRTREPFGGLQVVLVGDFFQLPPVVRRSNTSIETMDVFDEGTHTPFAFRSSAWRALDPIVCYLDEQHRQSDAEFLQVLSAIRANRAGESEKDILRTRYRARVDEDTTRLFSHNADVDRVNHERLRRVPGEEHVFVTVGSGSEHLVAVLKKHCVSPEQLVLKVGARVMFTKNDSERRYVNGTLGTVVAFHEQSGYPVVETHVKETVIAEPVEWHMDDGGHIRASILQVPLRLAWAMTVHKSQGMSLDNAHMDLSQVFEYGQGYVALSRVRNLEGLSLGGCNDTALCVHPEVEMQDRDFKETSHTASRAFGALSSQEIDDMHKKFIIACGGKLMTQVAPKRKRRA